MKRCIFFMFMIAVGSGVAGEGRKASAEGSISAAVVAPLFEHGAGRGAVGPLVKVPAVFLPEEVALLVVREELEKAGLDMKERNVELREVLIAQRKEELKSAGGDWREEIADVPGQSAPLTADLRDPSKRVVVEYVSQDDYLLLGGARSAADTLQLYDFRAVARSVADRLRSKGRGAFMGVLYDPMATLDPAKTRDLVVGDERAQEEARVREIRAESQRLLREQVREFVEWLKKQGAL